MIWPIALAGLFLTVFGATAAAALITSSRGQLAETASRRLRGREAGFDWLPLLERDLAAASVTTTLGVAVLGAVFPAMFAGVTFPRLVLLLVVLAVPTALLSGYLLPRFLTHRRAARVAARFRPLLRPWSSLLSAILPAPPMRPEARLTELWRERAASGAGLDEELMRLGGVISFSERTVREVMTPRTELVALPEEASTGEVRQAFIHSGYSRLPVYRGTLDEIVGMVHAFDLFRLEPGGRVPVRPVSQVPGSRSCGDVLIDMRREGRHLAVVLDEFGGTLGIITLEDLLAAMVGEIVDEEDRAGRTAAGPDPGLLEVDGSAPVAQLEERFAVEFPAGQAATIGGRLAELAGRFPASGERFVLRGLEIDVLHASPNRVDRLLLRRQPPGSIPLDRPPP